MKTAAPKTANPPLIAPNAVYSMEQARLTFGLPKGTLPREIRLRRLRVAKRGGRYFILGAWLLAWIESGELMRRKPGGGPVMTDNGTAL